MKWMYAQDKSLNDVDALINDCTSCGVTDLLHLDIPGDELLAAAQAANVRVHVWWCVGYGGVRFFRDDVRDYILGQTQTLCQRTDIAGISLDYFRYEPGAVNNRRSAESLTTLLEEIRGITNAANIELSVACAPDYWPFEWPESNWCAEGVGQSPLLWLNENMVDNILFMHYFEPDYLEQVLVDYLLRYDKRAVSVISPLLFDESGDTTQQLTAEQWVRLSEINNEHGYDTGLFDHSAVLDAPTTPAPATGETYEVSIAGTVTVTIRRV